MKKASAIFIASLILFANLGMGVTSHFCGGKKVETGLTLGGMSFACGMASEEMEVTLEKIPNSIASLPCCADIAFLFDIEDQFNLKKNIESEQLDQLALHLPQQLKFQTPSPLRAIQYKDYSPPEVNLNFQTLLQVFRI